MAASVESGSAGKGRHATNAEVNVTPFVDVMLVLLIVFMVAAPIATIAVPLNLSNNTIAPPLPLPPVFVSLQDNGVINVGNPDTGEVAANWSNFIAVVDQKTGGDRNRQILIRADQKVPYAAVMRLMDELHRRGYGNKMLVTEDVVG
ncbi:MAG: biopolymer transporter ExbD [Alphaproteobacteria bacterium]|nr:biopolymer transporter ExbD [Alphaproteobacteria bacterium]